MKFGPFSKLLSKSIKKSKSSIQLLCLFSILILLSGCGTTFQSNWKNFRAYYNTFYNAKQSYSTGVDKNLGQPREYNPLQPIRIHQRPVNAGAQDFEKAIEKGADVLRKYEETKWIDDALFLIGKSYYFRQEYFSAEQKFDELFITSQNPDLIQQSIFWRGRVLLDMERYAEGIAYLNEMINEFEGEWKASHLAESKAVLAQLYVEMQNWEAASEALNEALPQLPNKELKERGYFLLGQIYEQQNLTESAYDAYRNVQYHFYEYRVQYLAKRKQAEVARQLDRHDVASAIFNEMVRDDKNLDYKSELDFELARTEQRRGNYQQAERIYQNLLRNQINRPTPEIAARSYYGLAEIYRYYYDDFSMAAAYYDSASQPNVAAERLPADFAAEELAESFGQYSSLKSQIALQDSLLWLGQLEQAEFDSVIAEVRAQKIAELEQLREEQEARENIVVNVNQDIEEEDVTSLRNGFLNSDNPVLQENARIQFLAIWGDRPLADNWRVRSIIQETTSDNEVNESNLNSDLEANEAVYVNIDLSGIPFTEARQDSVRKQIAAYQYQLGNLFFLSLNMPDSAVHYFSKAVQNPSNQNVTVVSLYSLSELYAMEGNEDKSREYADLLLENFPETIYAQNLADKFGIDMPAWKTSTVDTLQIYKSILEPDSITKVIKAENLKQFVQRYPNHKLAPQAQFQAIQFYMDVGKTDSLYEENINKWISSHEEWENRLENFYAEQDSAEILLQDSTISVEDSSYFAALKDSVLHKPDLKELFPYVGENWDSARTAIDVYLEMFPQSKYQNQVNRLKEEVKLPEVEESEEDEVMEEEQEHIAEIADNYTSCEEVEAELEVRGNLDRLLGSVDVPADNDLEEIRYQFLVNQRGIIDDYILLTQNAPQDLQEAFEIAISNLSFEPIMKDGQAIAVQCNFTFPLGDL